VAVSPPVFADKKGEPAESGVVVRIDPTQGGHGVGPVPADVDGEMRGIVAIVGWDDALVFCNGGPPVPNGVEQLVLTPSGNVTAVVHHGDIPVLVFDVTDIEDENDFFEKCASGELEPFATGTVKQRPIINATATAVNFKVKSSGVVSDGFGRDWTLHAFIKERFVFSESEAQVLTQWVKLTLL
jgi:hypothetical protein